MNKKYVKIIGGSILTLSVIGAVVCSLITISLSKQVATSVSNVRSDVAALSNAYIKQETAKTDSEFVTIGNSYKILDTSSISDAYRSNSTNKLTTPEEKETLKLASELLNKITKDTMTLHEKELAIHDWLVTNISIPDGSLSSVPIGNGSTFTPYGVLKYKKAVCVGYATTFKLLMNMVGAECMVEHNLSLTHSWNVVKLEDNQWYLVDVYNDAMRYTSASKNIPHQAFNVTNDFMNTDEPQFDTSLYPVASGIKFNYGVQNAIKIKDLDQLSKEIKSLMEKKTVEIYYELPKNTDYKYVSTLISGINARMFNGESIEAKYIPVDNSTAILCMNFSYGVSDLDEEKNYPNLTKQLDKLFGSIPLDEPIQ